MGERIENSAEEVVSDYASRKFKNAFKRLRKEIHGEGCGCNNCMKESVRDMNSWSDWVSKGNPTCEWEVRKENKWLNGRLKIGIKKKDGEED